VHAPSILFLDEPSTGLDPQNRANLWSHVLRMRAEHAMTVVLTTHYMDEADAMAERVIVVDHGRVIADDTADRLKADLAGDRILLTSQAAGRLAELARRLPARDVTVAGGRVEARVADGPRALPVLLAAAQADGVLVETAQVHRPTLDDVFLTLTGRSLREAAASERTAA
jgi:ABC-2 type transport system ATP-binding protein